MDEWKTGQKVPNLPAVRDGVKNTPPLSRPLVLGVRIFKSGQKARCLD